MPRARIDPDHFSPDTLEFVRLLHKHGVRYLVVGGEAVIFYGYARLTGDVDFFYDRTEDNATRLYGALNEFWDGDVPGIAEPSSLSRPNLVLQFGFPPNRIDLLGDIEGVEFDEVWSDRVEQNVDTEPDPTPIYYISLQHLIQNKRATGRPKDQEDLRYLRRVAD